MNSSEWKPLVYTCDCGGNLMRWDGRIFPNNVAGHFFDVRRADGMDYYPECLVQASDFGATARAITQDGRIIELHHGDLLKPIIIVDEATKKKLRSIASGLLMAESKARRAKELEYRKSELTSQLAEVDAELAKLKKESAK